MEILGVTLRLDCGKGMLVAWREVLVCWEWGRAVGKQGAKRALVQRHRRPQRVSDTIVQLASELEGSLVSSITTAVRWCSGDRHSDRRLECFDSLSRER